MSVLGTSLDRDRRRITLRLTVVILHLIPRLMVSGHEGIVQRSMTIPPMEEVLSAHELIVSISMPIILASFNGSDSFRSRSYEGHG